MAGMRGFLTVLTASGALNDKQLAKVLPLIADYIDMSPDIATDPLAPALHAALVHVHATTPADVMAGVIKKLDADMLAVLGRVM